MRRVEIKLSWLEKTSKTYRRVLRLLQIPEYELLLMMENPTTVMKQRELIHQEKTTRRKGVIKVPKVKSKKRGRRRSSSSTFSSGTSGSISNQERKCKKESKQRKNMRRFCRWGKEGDKSVKMENNQSESRRFNI